MILWNISYLSMKLYYWKQVQQNDILAIMSLRATKAEQLLWVKSVTKNGIMLNQPKTLHLVGSVPETLLPENTVQSAICSNSYMMTNLSYNNYLDPTAITISNVPIPCVLLVTAVKHSTWKSITYAAEKTGVSNTSEQPVKSKTEPHTKNSDGLAC